MPLKELLSRQVPADYLAECTKMYMKEVSSDKSEEDSVIIFRLSEEWFALSTQSFIEVSENRVVHHLPHKKSKVLIGLVNIRGQLRICFSLHEFLNIISPLNQESKIYQKLLVI